MNILDGVKNTLTKTQLALFKTQLKQMTPDQIILMMEQNVKSATKKIIGQFERGKPLDEIKKEWL